MNKISDVLTRGASILLASRIIVNFLTFVSTIVLARFLSPADFGLVAIAITVMALLTAVTEMSLSNALIQQKDVGDDLFHAAWSLGVLRGLGLAFLLGAMAYPTAHVYGDSRLAPIMLIFACSVGVGGFANPRMVVFVRDLDFRQSFIFAVAGKLAGVIVSLGIVYFYHSYWAIVASIFASQATNVFTSFAIAPFKPRFSLRRASDIIGFSIWLTAGQIVGSLNWRFDQLLLGYFLGKTELGLYTVGDNLAAMPTREAMLPLTATMFPAFSKFEQTADLARVKLAYQKSQAIAVALTLPIGVLFASLAEPIVLLILGEKWVGAAMVVEILAVVFSAQSVGMLAQPLAMAKGKTRTIFHRELLLFVIRIPLVALGLWLGGLFGILIARVISGGLGIYLNVRLADQLIGFTVLQQFFSSVRPAIACVAMYLSLISIHFPIFDSAFLSAFVLATQMITGLCVYAVSSLLLWRLGGAADGPEAFFIERARLSFNSLRKKTF